MRSTVVNKLIQTTVALSFFTTIFANAEDVVGTLPGSFSVSESGAATYSIPIEVPPGINGMQPNLALVYSSQAGNGELGIGWSLSGLSAITRCPTTLLEEDDDQTNGENRIDGVDYDENDQFCLDGERLIWDSVIDAYRTTSDSILQAETLGGGVTSPEGSSNPSYWKITLPNGKVSYYGAGQNGVERDARKFRASSGDEIYSWEIAEETDRYGNSVEYNYHNDRMKGIHELREIIYGTNNSILVKRTTSVRDDIISGYISGGTKYLIESKIESIQINEALFSYNFEYFQNSSKSRIQSISKCANVGNDCIREVSFELSEKPYGFGVTNTSTETFHNGWFNTTFPGRVMSMDVDGDGKGDLVAMGTGVTHIALSNGSGFNPIISSGQTLYNEWFDPELPGRVHQMDVNGDGRGDVVATGTGATYIALSNGQGFDLNVHGEVFHNGWFNTTFPGRVRSMDVNGDGRGDLVAIGTGVTHVALSNGDGFDPVVSSGQTLYNEWFNPELPGRVHQMDVNGDGRGDLVATGTGATYLALGNGQGFDLSIHGEVFHNGWFNKTFPGRVMPMDVNGDGKTDLVAMGTGVTHVALSNSEGFDPVTSSGQTLYNEWFNSEFSNRVKNIDVNLDGMMDVVATGTGSTYVAVSNGNGFDLEVRGGILNNNWFNPELPGRVFNVDLNGDGALDYVSTGTGETKIAFGEDVETLVEKIIVGESSELSIKYAPLTDSSIYARGNDLSYPDPAFQLPLNVVTSVTQGTGSYDSNGDERTSETTYQYEGMKIHSRGYGDLGFRKIIKTNNRTGITNTTTYSQDWENHTVGMVEEEQVRIHNGTANITLSKTVSDFETFSPADGIDLPYKKATTTEKRDLDGSYLGIVTAETQIDTEGRTHFQTSCNSPYEQSLIDSPILCSDMTGKERDQKLEFDYYPEGSIPNTRHLVRYQKTTSTVTGTLPFDQDNEQTRVTSYTYNDKGQVETETTESEQYTNESGNWLTKAYTYDPITGLPLTTTITGADIAPRTSEITYNPNNQVFKRINSLGHETESYYEDTRFPWLVTRTVGINELEAKVEYDSFGRPFRTETPTGDIANVVTTQRYWCDDLECTGEAINATYYTVTTSTTSPEVKTYYDNLNRVVKTVTKMLDADSDLNPLIQNVIEGVSYNVLGQVEKSLPPYFEGEQNENIYTETTYDLLGRPTAIEDPLKNKSIVSYNGRTITYTNSSGHTKTVIKNSLGQDVKVIDANSEELHYVYDPFGNLVSAQAPGIDPVKMGYNIRGLKTEMQDPDKGNWTYTYNVLGQLTHQTDAKGQTTFNEYDLGGRLVKRTDRYDLPQPTKISEWKYDEGNMAKGKLHEVTDNITDGYKQLYAYDAYGRPSTTTTIIDGDSYTQSVTYDSYGRVLETEYPTGFKTKNKYHSTLGILESIVDPLQPSEPAYWDVVSFNARGQLTKSMYDSSIEVTKKYEEERGVLYEMIAETPNSLKLQNVRYTRDDLGNITVFEDLVTGQSEIYQYDSLQRLDLYSTNTPSGNVINHMEYDILGNITSKPDSGTYDYTNVNSECGINVYGGPHAVKQITNGPQAGYFCYDENGSMVKNNLVELEYTSFNKPEVIKEGAAKEAKFTYSPNRNRYIREDKINDEVVKEVLYLDGYEQVRTTSNGTETTKHKFYVGGVAIVTKTGNSPGLDKKFLLKDALGSISIIFDESGNETDRMSFDPWGKRRTIDLVPFSDPSLYPTSVTDLGFTGHEHIDDFDLVHMNGRVFNPNIARFVSADPLIQSPSNLQSYNRYTYVFNNPMNFTDPSGFSAWSSFKKEVRRAGKKFEKAMKAFYGTDPAFWATRAVNKWSGRKIHAEKNRFSRSFWVTRKINAELMRSRDARNLGAIIAGMFGPYATGAYNAHMTSLYGGDYTQSRRAFAQGFARAYLSEYTYDEISSGIESYTNKIQITLDVPNTNTSIRWVVGDYLNHGVASGGSSFLTGGNFVSSFGSGALTPLLLDLANLIRGYRQLGGLADLPGTNKRSPSDIHFATFPIKATPSSPGWDGWLNLPGEFLDMFGVVDSPDARGYKVVILRGKGKGLDRTFDALMEARYLNPKTFSYAEIYARINFGAAQATGCITNGSNIEVCGAYTRF